jgi:peroxiredoxin
MFKQIAGIFMIAAALASCSKAEKGKFEVSGEIRNVTAPETVFLEELVYGNPRPEVVDSVNIKAGAAKFTLGTVAPEEGLYRVKTGSGAYYMLINDRPDVSFTSDYRAPNLYSTNSGASNSIKHLFDVFAPMMDSMESLAHRIDELQNYRAPDSIQLPLRAVYQDKIETTHSFLMQYADTTKSPAVAIFVVGMLRNQIDPERIKGLVDRLATKYPNHVQLQKMVADYRDFIAKRDAADITGKIAPDFTLPDTSGKSVSLSSFTGKYVLVDFWASWCGPCRAENPNVVRVYNEFKDKNFTILGVSLDKDKKPWLKAIKDDGLAWNHVSDLKYWSSQVVDLYKFEAIPFNVLVDPHGKIIAKGLRGDELEKKLAEVLK